MNTEETAHLTYALAHSGRTLDLGKTSPLAVDNHSTGGAGHRTTLVVVPLVVAAGLSLARISGRRLGFTLGTVDKLESFSGLTFDLDTSQFLDNLAKYRIVVIAQTPDLVPADDKVYALRDVTATVGSIPLIASSIMSMKLAVGAKAIVLDVKVGKGAFMKTEATAVELARAMIDLGETMGKRVAAVISDMNQPLGCAVGNAVEVKEAIDTLQGAGPTDFTAHCLTVGTRMLLLAEQANNEQEARKKLQDILKSGRAIGKLKDLAEHRGTILPRLKTRRLSHKPRLPTPLPPQARVTSPSWMLWKWGSQPWS